MKIYKFEKELVYDGVPVTCYLSKYCEPQNNALFLQNQEDEPYATCSINLDYTLGSDQIFIKDYSENEGMLNFLISNNIVSAPIGSAESGYVTIPICKVNFNVFNEVE